MIDLIDSHTHSIASGHAYHTMEEMIAAAKEKNLSVLALTEHAPAMPGSCKEIYFRNLKILPRKSDDMWVLYGTELNILDAEGTLDLPDQILQNLDVAIASIHTPTYKAEPTIENNTNAVIRAMANQHVNILGHPDDGRYPLDYGQVVRAAKAYHVMIEINNASFSETTYRTNTRENVREILKVCKQYQAPVIISSDAHADFLVGDHAQAWEMIAECGFPEELVANTNLDLYFSFLDYNPLFTSGL